MFFPKNHKHVIEKLVYKFAMLNFKREYFDTLQEYQARTKKDIAVNCNEIFGEHILLALQ